MSFEFYFKNSITLVIIKFSITVLNIVKINAVFMGFFLKKISENVNDEVKTFVNLQNLMGI